MKIIAIDPGYDRVGVAIIEKTNGKEKLLDSLCIVTDSKKTLTKRIFEIGQELGKIIKKWKVQTLAIEKLYFTSNQKTAMGVSEARGVIMYEAEKAGLKIFEYTPIQIKVAVTGYGKATKDNVFDMTKRLIKIPDKKTLDDEIDAIAIGLTCFACEKFN